MNHLTRLMAKFLAPRHIAVNGIAPGYFPSKMTAGLGEEAQEGPDARLRRRGGHRFACATAASAFGSSRSTYCQNSRPMRG